MKIQALGVNELLEGVFCILLVTEALALQKVVTLVRSQTNMEDEKKIGAQFLYISKPSWVAVLVMLP